MKVYFDITFHYFISPLPNIIEKNAEICYTAYIKILLQQRVDNISKTLYFYFDDSGVLHKNADNDYFVYAGYVFCERSEVDAARRKYRDASQKIRTATGRTDELKAASLKISHKRALFNSVREYRSVSAAVAISSLYSHILADKHAICRYKDYILKLCVKRTLEDMIARGELSPNDDIVVHVSIDEQLTASNGYYSLHDSIVEELQHGIISWNYGVRHPALFNGSVEVHVRYCESSHNYLIQASDILANRVWTSYKADKPTLRESIPNHLSLTFP